jgi:pilus assembly protein Flp/PilA
VRREKTSPRYARREKAGVLVVGKEDERMEKIKRFFRDEEGVTAIEYGLIAALIALVILVGVALVGTNLNTTFDNVASHI